MLYVWKMLNTIDIQMLSMYYYYHQIIGRYIEYLSSDSYILTTYLEFDLETPHYHILV